MVRKTVRTVQRLLHVGCTKLNHSNHHISLAAEMRNEVILLVEEKKLKLKTEIYAEKKEATE